MTEETSQPQQIAWRPLNIFFDVDNTLIMWNGSLRNHVRHTLETLKASGHSIYIWSGVGIRRWDMRRHQLDEFVTDYFVKPLEDHHARLVSLGVTLTPDYVIDDHKSVVDAFGGYHIPDMADADDDHLLRVIEDLEAFARGGVPSIAPLKQV